MGGSIDKDVTASLMKLDAEFIKQSPQDDKIKGFTYTLLVRDWCPAIS